MRHKTNSRGLARSIVRYFADHKETTLKVVAIAGVIATAATTVKATTEAERIIAEFEGDETPMEKAKALAPAVIKPVIAGSVTICSIIALDKSWAKKFDDVWRLYRDAKDIHELYVEKTTPLLEAGKAEECHNEAVKEVVEDRIEHNIGNYIYETGTGNELIYLENTGQFFRGNPRHVEHVLYTICDDMRSGYQPCVSVAYLQAELSLPSNSQTRRDGWNACDGTLQWITTSGMTEDLESYIIFRIITEPYENFDLFS